VHAEGHFCLDPTVVVPRHGMARVGIQCTR
jgi:hypothetical protein